MVENEIRQLKNKSGTETNGAAGLTPWGCASRIQHGTYAVALNTSIPVIVSPCFISIFQSCRMYLLE